MGKGPHAREEVGVGAPTGAAEPPSHWFEPLADHLGGAYLRYSFTKGTRQEVDHLVGALGLRAGQRVLDVGCGPGRHAAELARRGLLVHGVDISERFVELAKRDAPDGATFERLDARTLPFEHVFDAAICLCQGAFGLMVDEGDDDDVVAGIARALVPGGVLGLTAFNAYFAVKYHVDATFDAATGISHERTEIRNEVGEAIETDMWTCCYTPRELRSILGRHDLVVDRISSVEPGAYGSRRPTVESPEFLVIAHRNNVQ
jgi:SAM-dependent methyltransferase